MWKLTKKPELVRSTRKLAQHFASMTPCPSDREMKDGLLKTLSSEIKNNRFRGCTWASANCKEDKKTYRVNGKHTSTVLSSIEAFDGFAWPFVLIEEYECDTKEDLAQLYSTFDLQQSSRNSRDINKVYAASDPRLESIKVHVVSRGVTGISYAEMEDNYNRRPAVERAAKMIDHVPYFEFLNTLLSGRDASFITRGPIAAAMFKTWNKSREDSIKFWYEVRDGTNQDHLSPSRKLQKFLLTSASKTGRTSQRQQVTTRRIYVSCLHAWNAWRRKESTDLRYYPAAKTPAVV